MNNLIKPTILVSVGMLLSTGNGLAQDAAPAAAAISTGDTAWITAATALVLFMTIPGLSLFYAGLVRGRNVLSVLMHCFAITCVMSILWLVGAYSLAFADGNSFIGGMSKAMLSGVELDVPYAEGQTIPELTFFAFQMTFFIITPALMVGAFVERMKFSAMLWFTTLWALLVYVPVCHMVWGGGSMSASRESKTTQAVLWCTSRPGLEHLWLQSFSGRARDTRTLRCLPTTCP